ncbi:hypothetical protein LTR10_019319 [Elasticomyces elasticus]|uniref:Amino acid permease/ SLC12A domain-containing protein n=1 Tax=Exophiala sideris TaxID=1016849 RepID=A0ABR0J1L2_9EURO|nr:hypothetical protein LTR10_019319 [Elasticomyces elasticus]KAK5024320.1 hypothetical protein LTS07_008611 [Exophiala sideris]KAK5054053.1 hypothetical protein LTR69_009015 [Exophiala sideris]
MSTLQGEKDVSPSDGDVPTPTAEVSDLINASGHVQELDRNFSLLAATGIGLVVGSVWPAIGGSILVAIFNGGPPGVIYEFITVSLLYWIVAASLAELASAIPSSGGVYHWASVTPGKRWGRVIGDFVAQPWHVFVTYLIVTWIACICVCLFNSVMPHLNLVGIFMVLAGFFITIVVVAAMPGSGGRPPHASSSFVWSQWTADIGYSNGHIAEEIPNPGRNVPIAIAAQMVVGFLTGVLYIIAIMYAINDYDALFDSAFPVAEIYLQATGSSSGAIGLLCLLLFCVGLCLVGVYITAGRTLWALARDQATPFPKYLGKVSPKLGMPFVATITCGCLVTVLGCIYEGSTTAFNAFVGSFVLMSSASYIAAILPHLLTGRKNIHFGPFRLGKLGIVFNFIACGYMIVWFVIYCFPFALPTDAQTMNYACVIWGGLTIFVTIWWFIGQGRYVGPQTTGGINAEIENVRRASVAKRASV